MTNWRDSQIRPGMVGLGLLLLTTLLLVTGCGGTPTADLAGTSEAPASVTQPLPTTEAPGTPEGEAMQSPLAPPAVDLPWDAAPAEGKAIVRGQIEIEPGVLLGELFLASAVPTTDPEVDLLELDHDNSPNALLDRTTGRFMFLDVEPGRYGLVVWEPMSSAPVADPKTGETLFFEVSAGEVKDLGTIRFP